MSRPRRHRHGAVARLSGLAALVALVASAAHAQPAIRALTVEGTDFRLSLTDGRVLRGADLVGAQLDLGPAGSARIAAAQPDARDPRGEVWLFDLRDARTDAPLCSPDPDGASLGFPLAEGDDPARFTLTCTSGAIGKCVRFGYAPWRTAPDGRPMRGFHRACMHALRAAYGGDERAWTVDGTSIDLYDRLDVQQPETVDPMPFEAGWSPDGAVCVAHPRIPANGDQTAIEAAHPALVGRTGAAACDEAQAAAAGALVFTRSKVR